MHIALIAVRYSKAEIFPDFHPAGAVIAINYGGLAAFRSVYRMQTALAVGTETDNNIFSAP